MISAPSKPWLTDGLIGRCMTCNELVYANEWGFDVPEDRRHPCWPGEIDYSLRAVVNPTNERWRPGYTFAMEQASGTRTRHQCRGNHHIRSRTYTVTFQIDHEGVLRHISGPKPLDSVMAAFERQYQRERPGSNWYPGADDDDEAGQLG